MIMNLISSAHAVTISMSIPGTADATSTGPGAFVQNFYSFALLIGGVLAFGMVVFGGVKYTAAAGNPSAQSDAKEWIEAALLGLLLLVGAYFILNVINPQLTNLQLPTNLPATNVNTSNSGTGTTASNPTGSQTPTAATPPTGTAQTPATPPTSGGSLPGDNNQPLP